MLAGQSFWLVTAFAARRWPRFISPLNLESDTATQTTLINMNIGYSDVLKGIFEVQYSDYTTKKTISTSPSFSLQQATI